MKSPALAAIKSKKIFGINELNRLSSPCPQACSQKVWISPRPARLGAACRPMGENRAQLLRFASSQEIAYKSMAWALCQALVHRLATKKCGYPARKALQTLFLVRIRRETRFFAALSCRLPAHVAFKESCLESMA
ncbi:hypothetical protein [Herbaspirillum rubrisubalbicans]|uniref:hypothetical protein n=1 Tax=Herbaspirillum rubrisubalbicans TaxID=80842 RepID=UPI0012E8197B|nr:hypothetical protein [Herbaspirillum rubrisubalbicans]